MTQNNHSITIIEVGPRDGLQNEKKTIALNDKIKFIELLSDCGFSEIEAGAFVSPKWVPQMADSENIFEHFASEFVGAGHARSSPDADFPGRACPAPTYTALVPNKKGMERAIACGVKKIALFTAASETFNIKNINCTIAESLERFEPVLKLAEKNKIAVRGYVSTAFVCPYEGNVTVEKSATVIEELVQLGITDISIGDTVGKASRQNVSQLLERLLRTHSPEIFAMHFHDTYQLALKNIEESFKFGIRRYDASTAGLGGCPYAPGAKGNVNTRLVVEYFEDLGQRTGVDLVKLKLAEEFIKQVIQS